MPSFNYMSWNIQNFSEKHADKLLRNITAKVWLAKTVVWVGADMLGVMEVTLGTGETACQALLTQIAAESKQAGWNVEVSQRSVPSSSSVAARADKYAVFYRSSAFAISDLQIYDGGISWSDRAPLYWRATAGSLVFDFLLWHAPAPNNTKKQATISDIADAVQKIIASSSSNGIVVSGDFNLDTGTAQYYEPLTDLHFTPFFSGQKTTLKTLKNFINNHLDSFVLNGNVDQSFLASAYDNVFTFGVKIGSSNRILIPEVVASIALSSIQIQMLLRKELQELMKLSLGMSDHLPLSVEIQTPT